MAAASAQAAMKVTSGRPGGAGAKLVHTAKMLPSMSRRAESDAPEPTIPPTRKILCTLVLAAALSGLAAAGAGAGGPTPEHGRHLTRTPVEMTTAVRGGGPDLVRAKLSQAGRDLILAVRTASPVALAKLDPHPRGALGGRYLCLGLTRAAASSSRARAAANLRAPRAAPGERLLCLGGPRGAHRRVGLELRNAAGQVKSEATLVARVKRPRPTKLVLALDPAAAGLAPARYRWRVAANRRGCATPGCAEALPAGGATNAFRLRPVRPVGCTGGTAGEAFEGPSGHPVVALTFDDGPSEYTEGFLDALRAGHARGTFFEIGQEMPGREATMRRILREGDEIGDHTVNHVEYPGYAQIAGAAARIRAATRFQPCLFRPPGGAVNSSVLATAGALGMQTILWNVDPADWTDPGADAVYSRVVSAARPGSIVLMHDGGGDRAGTLAALPRIVDTLRARGYRFATVTQLLGQRTLYRPYVRSAVPFRLYPRKRNSQTRRLARVRAASWPEPAAGGGGRGGDAGARASSLRGSG